MGAAGVSNLPLAMLSRALRPLKCHHAVRPVPRADPSHANLGLSGGSGVVASGYDGCCDATV
eukprot:16442914-Heterocapsa_arctica.AAC.1